MHLPLRILTCLVPTALLTTPAAARQLVEPGDALVGTGAAVHVVRGDGLGVAQFTPRPGVFVNRLVDGGGVVVDAASERVFAVSNPAQGARIVMVDPDTGEQTNLTAGGGALLDLQDKASGLDVLLNGGLFVATWGEETVPAPVNTAAVQYVGPPTVDGVTALSYIGALDGGPFSVYGLAATQAEAGSEPQILAVPISPELGLRAIDWTTGDSSVVSGTPVQALATIHDLDFRCVVGPILTTCTRYWVESRTDDNGDCIASDAAIYAYNPLTDLDTLFVGPPLRCPVAIERAPDGSLLVLDGQAGTTADAAFVDLRLYRFTSDGGMWTPALLADESELPDSGPQPPALAVSTVALPEPDAGAAGLVMLLGIARRRTIGRGCWNAAGAAQR